jgi:hypothetical protein
MAKRKHGDDVEASAAKERTMRENGKYGSDAHRKAQRELTKAFAAQLQEDIDNDQGK